MSEIGKMPLGIAVAIPVPRRAVAVRSGTSEPRRKSLRVDHFQSSLYARSPEPGQEARSLQAEPRSEEHTSELQSLMRISYAVFCLKKKKKPRIESMVHNRHNMPNIDINNEINTHSRTIKTRVTIIS